MNRALPAACALVLLCLIALAACKASRETSDGEFGVEDVALDVETEGLGFVPTLDGPLRVMSATPYGPTQAMAPSQPVAVTFSRPMVPLGDAPEIDPAVLTLDPAVTGTLAWEGTQTLVFTPSAPLPPATAFRARLAPLTSLDGERSKPFDWRFETPRPRLTESTPARGEPYAEPSAPLRLRFNQSVDATRSVRFVTLTQKDGDPVGVRVTADGDSTLVVRPERSLAGGTAYTLRLLPGLPSAVGPLGMGDTTTVAFTTYGPLRLLSVDQERPYGDERTSFDPRRGVQLTLLDAGPLRRPPPRRRARSVRRAPPRHRSARRRRQRRAHAPVRARAGDALHAHRPRPHRRVRADARAGAASVYDAGLRAIARRAGRDPRDRSRRGDGPAAPRHERRNGPRRAAAATGRSDRACPPGATTASTGTASSTRATAEPEPIAATATFRPGLKRNEPGTVALPLDSVLTGGTGVVGLHVLGPGRNEARDSEQGHRAIAQVTRLGITAKFSPHQNLFFVTELATAAPVEGARVTVRDAENVVRWRGHDGRERAGAGAGLGRARDREAEPVERAAAVRLRRARRRPRVHGVDVPGRAGAIPLRRAVRLERRGPRRGRERVLRPRALPRRRDGLPQSHPPHEDRRRLALHPRQRPRLRPQPARRDRARPPPPSERPRHVRPRLDCAARRRRRASTRSASRTPPTPPQRAASRGSAATSPSGTFRVEAFRRAGFEVTARSAAPAYVVGDFFEGTVEGRYLFGSPMGGQPAQVVLSASPTPFAPPGFDAFRFGAIERDYGYDEFARRDTVLDADGTVSLGFRSRATRTARRASCGGKAPSPTRRGRRSRAARRSRSTPASSTSASARARPSSTSANATRCNSTSSRSIRRGDRSEERRSRSN